MTDDHRLTMRQSQIVGIVQGSIRSEGHQLHRRVVRDVVRDTLGAIGQVLRGGQNVNFRGFGTFYVHDFRGRKGLKPTLPRKQPKFRAGRSLKATLNA